MRGKRDAGDLPNRVREFRERAGLSLRELAPLVGISHGGLHRIETGVRELTQYWMEKIGAVLGVLPADLLRRELGGLDAAERRLVDLYRALPDANKAVVSAVLDSQNPWATAGGFAA